MMELEEGVLQQLSDEVLTYGEKEAVGEGKARLRTRCCVADATGLDRTPCVANDATRGRARS